MTNASRARIKAFIDWFIRSEFARTFGDTSDDWINDPERMSRCSDAAENGCDGSTHYEVIQDWRSSFSDWMSDYHRHKEYELFVSAVDSYFDDLEMWHETNGTLHLEIG